MKKNKTEKWTVPLPGVELLPLGMFSDTPEANPVNMLVGEEALKLYSRPVGIPIWAAIFFSLFVGALAATAGWYAARLPPPETKQVQPDFTLGEEG